MSINSGNGLMPLGNKPLIQPKLTQISRYLEPPGHKDFKSICWNMHMSASVSIYIGIPMAEIEASCDVSCKLIIME